MYFDNQIQVAGQFSCNSIGLSLICIVERRCYV